MDFNWKPKYCIKEMVQTKNYKSPEVSIVEISGEQAFAVVSSQVDSNIKSLTVTEEEW